MEDNQAASGMQTDEQAQPDVSNADQNTAEESSSTGTSSPQEKVINLAEFFAESEIVLCSLAQCSRMRRHS